MVKFKFKHVMWTDQEATHTYSPPVLVAGGTAQAGSNADATVAGRWPAPSAEIGGIAHRAAATDPGATSSTARWNKPYMLPEFCQNIIYQNPPECIATNNRGEMDDQAEETLDSVRSHAGGAPAALTSFYL
jgi:hypothetical protein